MDEQRQYRLGESYRDLGSVTDPDDEFLRWVNLPGSGMRNMGGIRPLKFVNLDAPVHAFLVLVTDQRSSGSVSNPWQDTIDLRHGQVLYWGDAKFDKDRGVHDFVGNRALVAADRLIRNGERRLAPPILHFSKTSTGYVRFNGLCILDRLDLTYFEDGDRPVRNYRAHLTVLAEDSVDVAWLHRRASAPTVDALDGDGPDAWIAYQGGVVRRLQVFASSTMRSTAGQLPDIGSDDAVVLAQLKSLASVEFEAAIVALFHQYDAVPHRIAVTTPSSDGGFSFSGRFMLAPPLRYEVDFLGEAKPYDREVPVAEGLVSRLAARLGRGQYGLFVTTSYYTSEAQEVVLSDGYPTALIAGGDLVSLMRTTCVARGRDISTEWLSKVVRPAATDVARRSLRLVIGDRARYI